jgi:hypothetical protein
VKLLKWIFLVITVYLVYLKMENPDVYIRESREAGWKRKQVKNAERAKKWELEHWLSYDKIASMTSEEYLEQRWYSESDKQGKRYLRNMVASIMQSDKTTAGKSFETAAMELIEYNNIAVVGQVHIDDQGDIHAKKSCHRIDGYISSTDRPTNIKDCYVLSKKTTLRERWNQDIWCVPLCKGLVILTLETPTDSTIESIKKHNAIVVFPNAEITETTWSYKEFLTRMKLFQQ